MARSWIQPARPWRRCALAEKYLAGAFPVGFSQFHLPHLVRKLNFSQTSLERLRNVCPYQRPAARKGSASDRTTRFRQKVSTLPLSLLRCYPPRAKPERPTRFRKIAPDPATINACGRKQLVQRPSLCSELVLAFQPAPYCHVRPYLSTNHSSSVFDHHSSVLRIRFGVHGNC